METSMEDVFNERSVKNLAYDGPLLGCGSRLGGTQVPIRQEHSIHTLSVSKKTRGISRLRTGSGHGRSEHSSRGIDNGSEESA